jgi:LacI family transcriptional regulator
MGYDDLPAAAESATPLTSMRQPLNKVGEIAVQMLTSVIEKKSLPKKKRVILKPELVARTSTRGK